MQKQKKTVTRVCVRKTKGEWDIIEKRLKELSDKSDVNSYVNHEIRKLLKKYDECHNCIPDIGGKIQTKRPYLRNDEFAKIKILAKKMKIPIADVIDFYIISPLLIYDPAG